MAVTSSTELCRRCRDMSRAAGELNRRLRRQRRIQQGLEPDPVPPTAESDNAPSIDVRTDKR